MSVRIIALFWLNLEVKSLTIKLLIGYLNVEGVASDNFFDFRLDISLTLKNGEIETIGVPVVWRSSFGVESVDFSGSIDGHIDLDGSLEVSWLDRFVLLHRVWDELLSQDGTLSGLNIGSG